MKSRASFVLMEQIIMLLVFSFCVAICSYVFYAAHHVSAENDMRMHGAQIVQNMAETLQSLEQEIWEDKVLLAEKTDTEISDTVLYRYYDEKWQLSEKEDGKYCLTIKETKAAMENLAQ